MKETRANTKSLCPVCLNVIPAQRVQEGQDVFIEKTCPDHGEFKTITWRGEPSYQDWNVGVFAPGPKLRLTETVNGCPNDCGICPEHKAQSCTILMEVTSRCNLQCPVCFASSEDSPDAEPTIDEIRGMLETVIESADACPLQLSGGEPTLRDDLPDIISLAKQMGFPHVQVNTHGLRLANDVEYLQRFKDAGVDLIYLQFDGISDDVYQRIRGANLFDSKVRAIENCAEAKVGVQLVPTLIPGINDHQIGGIIQFACKYIPVIKGVHFQPVSYFGRYPVAPADKDRITTPDVLRALEEQTGGEIKASNFLPRRRHDSHCGFSGFFVLTEDDKLVATTVFKPRQPSAADCNETAGRVSEANQPSEHVRKFITEKSKYIEPNPELLEQQQKGTLKRFIQRAKTHFLSISGMPFQDAWTVDLERLRGCCIHVITRDKKLVPFCAHYITNADGERLHGVRKLSFRK